MFRILLAALLGTTLCLATNVSAGTVQRVPPAPPTLNSNSPVLEGGQLTLQAVIVIGGTYIWTGPNNFVSNEQNPLINDVGQAHAGTYSCTVTVNGETSAPSTINVVVTNQAPRINSGPTANPAEPTAGVDVGLSVDAVDKEGATIAWDFGDGTTGTGPAVTHAFTPAGTYNVKMTATDSLGLKSERVLALQVGVNYVQGVGKASERLDSDGDGFADELEVQAGTDKNNISSTPFDGQKAGTVQPLTIAKMSTTLVFKKDENDSLQISGTLPVPAGLTLQGQTVIMAVGGVVRVFTLEKSASGKDQDASFKLSAKQKKGTTLGGPAKWTLKTSKGLYQQRFEDENLTKDGEGTTRAVQLDVTLLFDNTYYFHTQDIPTYTVKNQVGKGKF